MSNSLSISEFLNAILKVHQDNPLMFAKSNNPTQNLNFITGKMMVETKGRCKPETAMKIAKILVEDLK